MLVYYTDMLGYVSVYYVDMLGYVSVYYVDMLGYYVFVYYMDMLGYYVFVYHSMCMHSINGYVFVCHKFLKLTGKNVLLTQTVTLWLFVFSVQVWRSGTLPPPPSDSTLPSLQSACLLVSISTPAEEEGVGPTPRPTISRQRAEPPQLVSMVTTHRYVCVPIICVAVATCMTIIIYT